MESINEVAILGNLGQDPKMHEGATPRSTLSVATSRRFRDAQQQVQNRTTWHRVVCFGKQAETICQYFKKGNLIYVRGRLETREFQKQDGTKGQITEIIMESFKFMDSKKEANQDAQQTPQQPTAAPHPPTQRHDAFGQSIPTDDEVPF